MGDEGGASTAGEANEAAQAERAVLDALSVRGQLSAPQIASAVGFSGSKVNITLSKLLRMGFVREDRAPYGSANYSVDTTRVARAADRLLAAEEKEGD